MGPPTAVPLRDVSRVMILLRSLFFNPSLPHPSGPNFWQGFKSSWRHGRSIEPCISKQDQQKKEKREKRESEREREARGAEAGPVAARRGGAVEMCGQVYFLAPRGCLTSGFLLHPCSRMPAPPPRPHHLPLPPPHKPSEENGGRWEASPMPTSDSLPSPRLRNFPRPFDSPTQVHRLTLARGHASATSVALPTHQREGERMGTGCAASAEGL